MRGELADGPQRGPLARGHSLAAFYRAHSPMVLTLVPDTGWFLG